MATEPPASSPAVLYVDTSALLKLLVHEAESAAIERELLTWSDLATSVITEVELPRAVARAREERPEAVIDGSVVLQGVLASAAIVPLEEPMVTAARKVKPVHVGALERSTSPVHSPSARNSRASQRTTNGCKTPSSLSGSASSPQKKQLRRCHRPNRHQRVPVTRYSGMTRRTHCFQSLPSGAPSHRLHQGLQEAVQVPTSFPAPHGESRIQAFD